MRRESQIVQPFKTTSQTKPDGTFDRLDGVACPYGECKSPVGSEHAIGCVCRRRTVVIDVTFRYVKEVPEDWDQHLIESQLTESSSCATNIVDELHRLSNLEDGRCACRLIQSATLVREATEDDEIDLGDKPEDHS